MINDGVPPCFVCVCAAGFKKIFGESTVHGGWMSKKAGIRPLFQRHYFVLEGSSLRFYEDESKSSALGAIDMSTASSVRASSSALSPSSTHAADSMMPPIIHLGCALPGLPWTCVVHN